MLLKWVTLLNNKKELRICSIVKSSKYYFLRIRFKSLSTCLLKSSDILKR